MNALERLLRPLMGIVNRQIRAKTPARELVRKLDGQVVAIRVRDTALAMVFQVGPDEIELLGDADDPDVVITASLLTLAGMATRSGGNIGDGSFDMSGNIETAQGFQQLMAYGKPDLEEELSGLVGDVAARGLSDVARNVSRWSRDAHATVEQNITEYLQEESRALPSRYEVERFRNRVNVLRDDVDRLDARLTRLERSTH
jgi:ubiquinone biosynthesis protein UbiJ